MTTRRIPLKDQLFTRENVELIAGEIEHVHPAFQADEFVDGIVARSPSSGSRHASTLSDGDFGDFIYARPPPSTSPGTVAPRTTSRTHWPRYARSPHGSPRSSPSGRSSTPSPTGPWATLAAWTDDEHYHLRRLCSEGTRPRLPWAGNLGLPPDAAIAILGKALHRPRATSPDPSPTTSTTSPSKTPTLPFTHSSAGMSHDSSSRVKWPT